MAVAHALARTPAAAQLFLEYRQHGRAAGVSSRVVVHVVEGHVVEAGGVLQQVHHAHGVSGFPGVVDGDFGGNFVHLIVEAQLALLNELHQAGGDKGLRNRADAKQRVGRHGPFSGHVGQPQPAFEQHRVVADQRKHQPRNVFADHHVPERILELRQGVNGGNARLGFGRHCQ